MFDVIFTNTICRTGNRHDELLREAEAYRLARLATSSQVTFVERVLTRFGDMLISTGITLKRHRPQNVTVLYAPLLQAGRRLEL